MIRRNHVSCDPLVSILIPLYNSVNYIAETLDSCLSQTYQNIEIIIIDDGSTDNGYAVAKKYEDNYDFIKLYTQENAGAQVTRNKLFELSSGVYIQYLDADDLLHPSKIKIQMDVLVSERITTITFCPVCTFVRNINIVTCKDQYIYKNYKDPVQFLIDMWSNLESLNPTVWLTHRKLIESSGGWDTSLIKNQDGDFFARVVLMSSKVIFTDNTSAYYRLDSPDSISKNISTKAQKSVLLSIDNGAKLLFNYRNCADAKYALARQYSALYFMISSPRSEIHDDVLMRLGNLGYKKPIIIDRSSCAKFVYNLIGADFYIYFRGHTKKFFGLIRGLLK